MNEIYKYPFWFPETLSSTRDIEVFSQCEYKWFLTRVLHLSKHVKNIDLEAGSEFAKANEITRTAYFKDGKNINEAVALGVEHILTKYAETYENEKFKDTVKTPNKMAEVFQEMYSQVRLDELSIIPFTMEDGSLSVEQEFTIDLPFNHPETGKPLKLKCILDLLGIKDGVVFGMDDKTCKSVLKEREVQADLLRTQNQFVQYVTVGNMNKEKFGNLEITHFRVNRCKVKQKYDKNEQVIEPYEFEIDIWYQKTWWDTLLRKIERMLALYEMFLVYRKYNLYKEQTFLRAYGNACGAYFKPCMFTYHCTSGMAQDLKAKGFKQVICNSVTKGKEVEIETYRKYMLGEIAEFPKEEKLPEIVKETYNSLAAFLDTFI